MSVKDLLAKDSAKKKMAEDVLRKRVDKGAEQQRLIVERAVKTVIIDRLVYPHKMSFVALSPSSGRAADVFLTYDRESEQDKVFSLHNHALGQMASTAGMPRNFVSALRYGDLWRAELLAHNLNELFRKGSFLDRKKQPAKFLHRLVGDEVRGFLSRSYNRKLLTAPLLRAFIETCAHHSAVPAQAYSSDIRMWIACMLPYVFEPIDGEFVTFGTTFSNSDFGAGRTKVSGTVMRISSGTVSVMQDELSRVHLGSVIEESDIAVSDDTQDKELEAHKGGISDAVKALLDVESIDRMIRAIQAAAEQEIPWYKLKNQLGRVLAKKEIDMVEDLLKKGGDDIIDLPPPSVSNSGDKIATGWWAANVLGWMANREEDTEKKQNLQSMAGTIVAS